MENDKSLDVLNSLVVINNDRIQGYETAIDETNEQDLKVLFGQFIQTSMDCKSELVSSITKLGGIPEEGTRIDGKIYRIWMDLKALVTAKDRKAILNSCEYGEDVAVNSYKKALEDSNLAAEDFALVTAQYAKIKADHDTVRNLRDTLVEHDNL